MFLGYIVRKNYNIHSPAKSLHKFSKLSLGGVVRMSYTSESNFKPQCVTSIVDPPASALKGRMTIIIQYDNLELRNNIFLQNKN